MQLKGHYSQFIVPRFWKTADMPLRKIPKVLSPDLLHALCSMGHGDEIGVLSSTKLTDNRVCHCTGLPTNLCENWGHFAGGEMGSRKVFGIPWTHFQKDHEHSYPWSSAGFFSLTGSGGMFSVRTLRGFWFECLGKPAGRDRLRMILASIRCALFGRQTHLGESLVISEELVRGRKVK